MKNKYLQMKMTTMAVLMSLLFSAVGMTEGYAYNVIISDNVRGAVRAFYSNPNPDEGDIVKLIVTPTVSNPVRTWIVLDSNNNGISVTRVPRENAYTFVMPASDVTVSATFVKPYLLYTLFEDYQACERLVPQREGNGIDDLDNLQLPADEARMKKDDYYQNGVERTTGFLALAQNEKEGFQVFYREQEKERNLRIEVSPFLNSQNEVLPHLIYWEDFFYEHSVGIPDSLAEALIPYAGETQKTTIGHNKVFFVELKSNKDQTPGEYVSTITAYEGNEVLTTRTITAKVWNFALPENHYSDVVMGLYNRNSGYGATSSLFKLNGINVDDQGNVTESDLPAAKQILDGYQECLLEHGVCTFEIPRWKMADDSKAAELTMADSRRRVFAVPVNPGSDFNGSVFNSSAQEVIANYKSLVYDNPFLKDKAYFYLMDEPSVNEGTEALLSAISNNLATLWPGYHAVVAFNEKNGGYSEKISMLEGKTDILCPNQALFDPYKPPTEELPNNPFDPVEYALKQSNFENFIDRENHPERFRTWRYQGDGKCGGTYFWISSLSTVGVMRRIVFWQQYRMNSDGWVHWNCAYLPDNWTKKTIPSEFGSGTGNGDGILLYPGTMFGQSAETPVVSLRLKQLAAGIDDYDYLRLGNEFLSEDDIIPIINRTYISNHSLNCYMLNKQYDYYTPYTCTHLQRARYDLGQRLDTTNTQHTWGEWQTAVLPDETHNGMEIRTCSHCGTQESRSKSYSSLYHFEGIEDNQWANLNNWANIPETLPTSGEAVVIASNCEINTNTTVFHVIVNDGVNLTIKDGATLESSWVSTEGNAQVIIEDGAQLYTQSEGVQATVKKNIAAHGSSGGWHFISSSVATDVAPSTDNHILSSTTENYDLYFYDEPAHYWRNYKESDNSLYSGFNIEPMKGYLYANAEEATLSFAGTLQPGITATSATLSYEAQTLTGWNLVGNPFPCNVYVDKSYYVLNENGSAIYPTPVSIGTAIGPCTGIMVKAEGPDETVTFNKTAPETQGQNKGVLQITLSQFVELEETPINRGDGPSTSSGILMVDKAVVSFNEGDQLGKFYFGHNNANVYFPQGTEEFAIVSAKAKGEMPLNFVAKENGQYTISVNPENVEMNYLHLIDNMTGEDVDLLQTHDYTFNAKTTDYESRFRLVFSANKEDGPSTGSGTFAFYSNGNWIINNVGEATLQVVDLTGRILSSETVNGSCNKHFNVPAGVYVLRLLNGDNVRAQKIVVR